MLGTGICNYLKSRGTEILPTKYIVVQYLYVYIAVYIITNDRLGDRNYVLNRVSLVFVF